MDTSMKQALKARAHHLKPVVLVGANGLSDAVVAETEVALVAHELIKVKIAGQEKEDRVQMAKDLSQSLNAELVQLIGNIAVLYRKRKD